MYLIDYIAYGPHLCYKINIFKEISRKPISRLVHESRMIRMMGLIIQVAQIIILMTSMIAQICKNTRESIENKLRGAAAPQGKYRKHTLGRGRALFSFLSLMLLHIWAIILAIRMIIWATRMISPIILNHPRLMHKPVYRVVFCQPIFWTLCFLWRCRVESRK